MKDNKIDFYQVRIGNYVNFVTNPPYSSTIYVPCQILGQISYYKALVENLTKPTNVFVLLEQAGSFIELNEGWLLKLGFLPFGKDFIKNGIVIHRRKRGWVLRKSVPIIKYVHQLQNLYFCLKGEELFLKEKI